MNIQQLVREKLEKDGPRLALQWEQDYEKNRELLEKRKKEEARLSKRPYCAQY